MLDVAIAQAPVAIVILRGPTLVVEVANELALRNWGRSSGAGIVGRPLFEALPELANQGFEKLLEDVRTTGKPFVGRDLPLTVVDELTRKTEQRYIDRVYSRLADGDHILAVGTDVTDSVRVRREQEAEGERLRGEVLRVEERLREELAAQVRARRESENLAKALTEADHRKDEFLAMLAHELRNPMAAVSTALELLEEIEDDDPVRSAKYRETAKRQMGNLVRLVDDLLDVSRITRGKIELQSEALDLGAVVQQALSTTRPAFEARGHELVVSIGAGGFRMLGDSTRLEQIVVNLLTNAAKYTDLHGRIEVRLARERIEGGHQAVLRVRDNGRGIPPEMLERIFDLFVQVAPTIDRRTGGLGLGLTLVKRLAEMHGGTVAAVSEGLGKGSELILHLPIVERVTIGTPMGSVPLSASRRVARKILLVEDAEDVRETLSEYLRALGHEVHVACDGLEGVARMAELQPELAIVDIGLPFLDGFGVARQVRAAGNASYLIALTGYGGEESRNLAKEAGFDLHMTKPVDLVVLPRVIDRAGKS